jgi:hypothetical protein
MYVYGGCFLHQVPELVSWSQDAHVTHEVAKQSINKLKKCFVRLVFFSALAMKIALFWDVTPCGLVDPSQSFKESSWLQFHVSKIRFGAIWYLDHEGRLHTEALGSSEIFITIYQTVRCYLLETNPQWTASVYYFLPYWKWRFVREEMFN